MAAGAFDVAKAEAMSNAMWDASITATLSEYITIENQSPAYDPTWQTNGLLRQAAELMVKWVKAQDVPTLEVEIVEQEGLSPLIFVTVDATNGGKGTVLAYAHFDKQPPMTATWEEGLHPYKPVIRDGKLYGRGGADDGYGIFSSIVAIKALKEQGVPHPRFVIMVEGSEESGSPHLSAYVESLASRIGTPDLVLCLDSGCGNYEQLWLTTSLRGCVMADLKVAVLSEGVHSGASSGVVPSSFRIIRQLISRVEDQNTGEVIRDFHCEIPPSRLEQAIACAKILGPSIWGEMPFLAGVKPVRDDPTEAWLNKTWRPALSITGGENLPPLANAGNVLRTHTTLRLSLRIPPLTDSKHAADTLVAKLEADPPYGAHVSVDRAKLVHMPGWMAPVEAPWLLDAVMKASRNVWGKDSAFFGEGGTIPFMGMLNKRFPEAQFIITGLLGPKSNAHGPNEFIDLAYAKKLTAAVASILASHAAHVSK